MTTKTFIRYYITTDLMDTRMTVLVCHAARPATHIVYVRMSRESRRGNETQKQKQETQKNKQT